MKERSQERRGRKAIGGGRRRLAVVVAEHRATARAVFSHRKQIHTNILCPITHSASRSP